MTNRTHTFGARAATWFSLLAAPLALFALLNDSGGAGDGTEGGGAGGAGGAGSGGSGDAPPEFKPITSQDELNRLVGDRLARERSKYADYDALKDKASKFDELDAANKSELEKAQEAARKAGEERDVARAATQQALRRSAIVNEAVKAKAVDPEAVAALIDPTTVTVGDDGQVTGVEEAVKTLLAGKPYLVGTNGQQAGTNASGSADSGARGGAQGAQQLSRDDLKSMSPEEIVQARKDGRLTDLLTHS